VEALRADASIGLPVGDATHTSTDMLTGPYMHQSEGHACEGISVEWGVEGLSWLSVVVQPIVELVEASLEQLKRYRQGSDAKSGGEHLPPHGARLAAISVVAQRPIGSSVVRHPLDQSDGPLYVYVPDILRLHFCHRERPGGQRGDGPAAQHGGRDWHLGHHQPEGHGQRAQPSGQSCLLVTWHLPACLCPCTLA
jgi:hypothetical protein